MSSILKGILSENTDIGEAVDPAQQTVYMQVKGLVDQLDKRGKQNVAKALKKNLGIVSEGEQKPGEDYKDPKEADYDEDYQDMVKRVGQKAKQQEKKKEKVDEGWKEETAEHDEFLAHARKQLQASSSVERIRLAQRLSKLEQKHFPEMFSAGSNGMSSSMTGMLHSIEDAKPNQNAGSTTTQTPFGSVTTPNKPASDPEPLRPNNNVRPTSKPEKPMLNVLQGDDVNWTNPQYAHLFPDDEQDDEEDKSKPFNWKEFIAMGLIAIKIPGIASGLVKDFKERFGVDMSVKDIFKYAMHVFRTKEEIHPAQWKFEQEGGDYENAVDQIPADQDEQVPAQAVFDTMASTLAPATAGNDAFANMVNHLGKKEEAEIEKKLSESLGYKSIKENAGNPPAFYTKCKTCGTPYNEHFRFDSNGKILSSLVRHPLRKDDFPGMSGMSFGKQTSSTPRPVAPANRVPTLTGGGVDSKGRTQKQWIQAVKAKFPDAQIIQAKMIDGPCVANLSDGRKLSWNKVEQGVAEGLSDTQKKIEDTINKLEDRLKHAKSGEQWDRISARIERLQAGLNRSKQGVAEESDKQFAQRMKKKAAQPPTKGMSQKEKEDKGWAKPKEQGVAEEKQRLDPKCWTGYKKAGTKMKGGVRVNNCVPVKESKSNILKGLMG